MKSNSILSAKVEKINTTLVDDHNAHMSTVKGLEKLGDSVVSLKGILGQLFVVVYPIFQEK